MSQIIIDLDGAPFVPEGWVVESHQKGGQFTFDPSKVRLHLDADQQNGKSIKGHKLRRQVENEPIMNAVMLDWYLANLSHIPEEWEEKLIFFWGDGLLRRRWHPVRTVPVLERRPVAREQFFVQQPMELRW